MRATHGRVGRPQVVPIGCEEAESETSQLCPSNVDLASAKALRRRHLEIENRIHRNHLETLVAERTADLTATVGCLSLTERALRSSQEELIMRLAFAAEFRDPTTRRSYQPHEPERSHTTNVGTAQAIHDSSPALTSRSRDESARSQTSLTRSQLSAHTSPRSR
jgi:hypothetical protein